MGDPPPHHEFKPHKSCCSYFNFLPSPPPAHLAVITLTDPFLLPCIYIYILTSWDRRSSKYYHKRSLELKVKLNYIQNRVSTKWLNLLRKICAIFAQIFFLRTFALFLRMKRNEFCAVLRNLCKTGNIFAKCCAWNEILVLANILRNFRKTASFTPNVTFKQIVKIDILSLELNNWRFIPYIKKY